MMRWLKEPLIQFLLIGAVIYGAYGVFAPPAEEDRDATVVVDANRISSFVAQWQARWNRPPTQRELDGLIDNYVREEILFRQGEVMGLAQDDPVFRRRIAQRVELLAADLSRLAEPTEDELEQYLQDNINQFSGPVRLTFVQVFFDPDVREETTLDAAKATLAQLRAAGVPDPQALSVGDRTMVPDYFDAASELEIRKRLGGGFTDTVMGLEPGSWHGPVLSGFGVHLVYVFERMPAPVPLLADVQPQVLEAWHTTRVAEFQQQFYQQLKSRYEVIIEDPNLPPGSILQIPQRAAPGAAGAEAAGS
jgi:peptidyl-prolyl cis-trans isomerase C